eukprot:482586-Amphidinium_carterae.1
MIRRGGCLVALTYHQLIKLWYSVSDERQTRDDSISPQKAQQTTTKRPNQGPERSAVHHPHTPRPKLRLLNVNSTHLSTPTSCGPTPHM